ncbi:TspO/MBR family protein [Aquisediminimonas profunda]|uniref:TspO/MBR family protein n=1 Tax=Aquisediminimonas profunda TaxID=1550733 RepID=UPI001C634638|nr:TspO/MBR family protein [Aquisediminimonas profunda]
MTVQGKPWIAPTLIAAVAATITAIMGATITEIGPWYHGLKQPDWAPPEFAFGIIWTVIFSLTAMAGIAAWRAAPDDRAAESIIGLFALNGFLNILWSLLFFRLHRPDWAQFEVIALWLSILALIVVSWRYSRVAGLLLLPYLIWVSIAAALNHQVVILNGPFG